MKIKEVCALTELTERTIRFYTEKKLIEPKTSEQNGRTYTEYTAADVDALRTIAVLRRMLFSLEEIQRMRSNPKEIPTVLEEYYARIAEEAEVRAEILSMDDKKLAQCKSITELARQMKQPAERRRLPEGDVNPNFGRLDEEKPMDPEQAMAEFKAKQQRQEVIGLAIVLVIAAINVILSIVNLVMGSGGILNLMIDVVISVALLAGKTWARVMFIIGMGLSTLVSLMLFFALVNTVTNVNISGLIAALAIGLVYRMIGIILLVKSKCVQEYMYRE